MSYYQDALTHIKTHGWIISHHFGEEHERAVRRAISDSRKFGVILVPTYAYYYESAENATPEEVEQFLETQIRSLRTHYHNTIRPLKDKVKTDKMIKLMGQLETILVDNV